MSRDAVADADDGPGAPRRRAGRRSDLVRTSSGVSLLAGLALVSGLAVDAAIAARFGVGDETDAFFVAAVLPFATAAVFAASANQALVPLFNSWFRDETPQVAASRTGGLIGVLIVLGLGMASLGIALAPVLPRVLAPGAASATREAAVPLTMILFLTLATRIVAEAMRALLNSRLSFAAPAASPLWINVIALVFTLALAPRIGIVAVPWGYLAGSLAQVGFLAATARRRTIPLTLGWGFKDPEVRLGLRLLAWPAGSSGLNIFARSFERFVASFLGAGAITIVSYAWRILNAIGGTVFFRSVTVVLIPRLSEAKEDDEETRRLLGLGLHIMLGISVPLAVFLAAFAQPGVGVLFERGAFSGEMTSQLGSLLALYAMTLPFVAVTRALLTFFYSRLDMVVPFQNRLLNVVVNTGAASALVWALDLHGLAFAYLLATMASLAHAAIRSDAGALLISRRMAAVAVRVVGSTLVAALGARLMFGVLSPAGGTSKLVEAMLVGGSIVGGLIIIALLYALTGTRLRYRPRRRRRNIA